MDISGSKIITETLFSNIPVTSHICSDMDVAIKGVFGIAESSGVTSGLSCNWGGWDESVVTVI